VLQDQAFEQSKRLRGLLQPRYRLRVGEVRVFYDVSASTVEVLAIVAKSEKFNFCDTTWPTRPFRPNDAVRALTLLRPCARQRAARRIRA
jgi:hypothetical protein